MWKKAKRIIPGGSQLLSKRAEMFLPDQWPAYYDHAKGVEVTDLDGNTFIDMALMGVSACTLGYADKDVNRAVKDAVDRGSMCTLNAPEEIELAELLTKIHPWAGMVRYARSGGEGVMVAIRIARAHTRRDKIAFCGYHGWHDWYLASNLADDSNLDGNLMPGLEPRGVPRGLTHTTIPFEYNNIDSLKKLLEANKDQVAAIIMEPLRHTGPKDDFLRKVRELADEHKVVLIFDEISSGWKRNVGGVHLLFNVNPDIAVFSKAMANGYPMSAVLGKTEVMDSAQTSFISSTSWTERVGPAAAIATIKKMQQENVPAYLEKMGTKVMKGLAKLSKKHGIKMTIVGPPAVISFAFDYDNKLEIKTLFNQEMLKRGFLTSDHVNMSFAHKSKHIASYLEKADEVFAIIKKAIDEKKVKEMLEGPVVHTGFKRLVW